MPLKQSPATVAHTIEMKIPGSSIPVRYKRKEKLGEGLFSDVYRVTDDKDNSYALKVIKLDNSHLNAADRIALMRVIKKETLALKALGLLKSVKKEQDSFLILQPYFQGRTAAAKLQINIDPRTDSFPQSTWENNNQIIKNCFLELLELHNKDIVHMDPHSHNFMFDGTSQRPTMIDFGFAQRKNRYNAVEDNAQFFVKFDAIAKLNGNAHLIGDLFQYYSESTAQYIKEHKVETALKIFTYGVISIAAVYGLGTFAAARMMMWAYCKTVSLDFVTDFFNTSLERNQAQLAANKCDEAGKALAPVIQNAIKQGHILVASLLFWGIIRGYQSPLTLIEKLSSLAAENSPISQAFWSNAANTISALEVGNAALFYYPATKAYAYLSELFEQTFSTEKSLGQDCETIAQSKGWFNSFKGNAAQDPASNSSEPFDASKAKPARI